MSTVISAGLVLPTPENPIRDGAVLVDGTTITAVGPAEDIRSLAPPRSRHINFPRGTLLAGLINAHVHLCFDTSTDPVGHLEHTSDEQLRIDAEQRVRKLLDAGVTTVRDLGDRDHLAAGLRADLRARGVLAPRILAAGPPLTIPGGHCHFLGGVVGEDDSIRRRIDANVTKGADVIKVMASGGQMTPGGANMWESQFDERTLRVIVEHAAQHGVPVAAHAHGTDSIIASVEAGVSTIEHCTWMSGRGETDLREDVARRMAERGIAVCSVTSPNWKSMFERLGKEVTERMFSRLRWMQELGVRLITGTDGGLPYSFFDGFAGGLELYAHLGFANARILSMATADTADALGLGAITGRLDAGMSADLIVVEGNPLTDISALSEVQLLMAAGELEQRHARSSARPTPAPRPR